MEVIQSAGLRYNDGKKKQGICPLPLPCENFCYRGRVGCRRVLVPSIFGKVRFVEGDREYKWKVECPTWQKNRMNGIQRFT